MKLSSIKHYIIVFIFTLANFSVNMTNQDFIRAPQKYRCMNPFYMERFMSKLRNSISQRRHTPTTSMCTKLCVLLHLLCTVYFSPMVRQTSWKKWSSKPWESLKYTFIVLT